MLVKFKDGLTFDSIEWSGRNLFEVEDFLEDACFTDEEDSLFINNRFLIYPTMGRTKVEIGSYIIKTEFNKFIIWPSNTFWSIFEDFSQDEQSLYSY